MEKFVYETTYQIEKDHWWFRVRRILAMDLLEKYKPGSKDVLEVGCGTGFFSEILASTGAKLDAVDISPELLEKARERAPGVRFTQADIEKLPFPDASFDAVVGLRILHHLDMGAAFPEIARVLKPGGCIAFCEPNMMNPQIMVQKNVPPIKRWLGDVPGETAFFRWGLARFLREKGFRNVVVRPFDFLHPNCPVPLIPAVERLGLALERLPVMREIAGSLQISAEKP